MIEAGANIETSTNVPFHASSRGNPSTGGTIPEGSSWFLEAFRAIIGQSGSAHNSYGFNVSDKLWPGGKSEYVNIPATVVKP